MLLLKRSILFLLIFLSLINSPVHCMHLINRCVSFIKGRPLLMLTTSAATALGIAFCYRHQIRSFLESRRAFLETGQGGPRFFRDQWILPYEEQKKIIDYLEKRMSEAVSFDEKTVEQISNEVTKNLASYAKNYIRGETACDFAVCRVDEFLAKFKHDQEIENRLGASESDQAPSTKISVQQADTKSLERAKQINYNLYRLAACLTGRVRWDNASVNLIQRQSQEHWGQPLAYSLKDIK